VKSSKKRAQYWECHYIVSTMSGFSLLHFRIMSRMIERANEVYLDVVVIEVH
jgi:hypothetical protein